MGRKWLLMKWHIRCHPRPSGAIRCHCCHATLQRKSIKECQTNSAFRRSADCKMSIQGLTQIQANYLVQGITLMIVRTNKSKCPENFIYAGDIDECFLFPNYKRMYGYAVKGCDNQGKRTTQNEAKDFSATGCGDFETSWSACSNCSIPCQSLFISSSRFTSRNLNLLFCSWPNSTRFHFNRWNARSKFIPNSL